MPPSTIRFTNPRKTDFQRTLTRRIESYFQEQGISQYGDYRMVLKTVVMFSLYFGPYFLILSGGLPLWAMWLGTVVMGLGLAGIGMAVMHDANHGAYSSKRWVNQLMGYSLDIIGGNSFNWKVQHNQQHHTYTNIHGHDDDIRERMALRFTPEVEHRKVHRFLLGYVFILYGLQTFFWVFIKDYINFYQYVMQGKDKLDTKGRVTTILGIIAMKALYFTYILVIPILLLHLPFWQILTGFMTMHFVAGLTLTTVFQLAHVVEGTSYPQPDENGNVAEEWAIEQMLTTVDFAPENSLITFYVGGLNYQVEHHLFQRICHVHYPAIAPIVKQTAEEYGVPYMVNKSFMDALSSHVKHLKKLSFNETLNMAGDI